MAAAVQHRHVIKLGLAGDTMLGRSVAVAISRARDPADAEREAVPIFHQRQQLAARATAETSVLFERRVLDIVHESDLMFLNLECCISTGTQRWPNPSKPFFFRAPPVAVEDLKALRVDAVTLGALLSLIDAMRSRQSSDSPTPYGSQQPRTRL